MGIKGLLRFMKRYIEPIHIKKFAGERVGIDAYSWLHKGAYSCSMELCLNTDGAKKLQYLNYFMHRINLLRHYEVTPVVVFDGGSIPCKAATEEERQRRRKANRNLALQKFKEGDVQAASELFQRGVSITPSMAHQLIQILKSENIEFIVAPYEADAQLAYLSSLEAENGGVAAVITEDSDLVAYGCQAIVFKMDRYGNSEEMLLQKVFDSTISTPSFRNFDMALFTGMCVLAGCDFLPSVPGIGIKKAHSLVSKYRNMDRALSVLKLEKGNQMPEHYCKYFHEAAAVFQHARIYDTVTKKLRHLRPLSEKLLEALDGELDFLGPDIPPSIAIAIAEGRVDPSNMEAFDNCQTSGCHVPIDIIPASRQHWQDETAALSAEKDCFFVNISNEYMKADFTVMKEGLNLQERKFSNEAAALSRLMLPPETSRAAGSVAVSESMSFKMPDNNPFKIRKVGKIHSSPVKSEDEVSLLIDVEELDLLVPSSNEVSLNMSENNHYMKRKRNQIRFDLKDGDTEPCSVLTEVGNSGILCNALASQESVTSTPNCNTSENRLATQIKKLKRSNCKGSENRTSILNYFSRV
ncbi:exonuclease 1 [Syzygium oleosum]|uniref:exonuclease 1 n=1 Tax=Syzygium oleosum TaxID=219896 RepID=UPI0011D1B5A9|nr:exonuclease 1 [Syzygium oleosum]